MRDYSPLDRIIGHIDRSVVTVFGQPKSRRSNPSDRVNQGPLTPQQRRHSAGLVRVDHSGEVCAQALYLGQAITARTPDVFAAMHQAADEENDHLVWCAARLKALHAHSSVLNPIWFLGSLALGLAVGLMGEGWNLGFLAETERQVATHLNNQLQTLAPEDEATAAILKQMHQDESAHADMAERTGAHALPQSIKRFMRALSAIMIQTAYWI